MGNQKSIHGKTEKRQRGILDAALACITERGFHGTSIADICEKSGSSVGSVYHHFGGKEQIAAELYLEGIRDYQYGLLASLEAETDAGKGTRAIIGFHLFWVRDNPDLARFLFHNRHEPFMKGTEENISALNREFTERISRWFAPHIKNGQIRKMGWDMYIAVLLGPCQEYARLYLSGKSFSDMDTAVREIADAAWRALATDIEIV